ncbi:glycosyltransferase family 2 protein [Xenorhabdus bovienii]|uniref:glycosyltransferase family 2 protein n=1 Tax=Xenorhabdus bovienii TaxID=40576 RepID=UPI003DA31E54
MATISVIIPSYNSEMTIIRALESVMKQSLLPKEIIIVDDKSTDNTLMTINNFLLKKNTPINIKIIKNDINSGPAISRNIGVSESTSEWIAFLDSDDYWLPSKLESQIKIAEQHNSDIVSCAFYNGNPEYENKKDGIPLMFSLIKSYNISFKKLLFKNFLSTPSVLMRKHIFLGFNEKIIFCEDYELWLRMTKSGARVRYITNKYVVLGKKSYGVTGLSSNLLKMQLGESIAISKHFLDNPLIVFASLIFSWIKFIKRLIIVLLRKFNLLDK